MPLTYTDGPPVRQGSIRQQFSIGEPHQHETNTLDQEQQDLKYSTHMPVRSEDPPCNSNLESEVEQPDRQRPARHKQKPIKLAAWLYAAATRAVPSQSQHATQAVLPPTILPQHADTNHESSLYVHAPQRSVPPPQSPGAKPNIRTRLPQLDAGLWRCCEPECAEKVYEPFHNFQHHVRSKHRVHLKKPKDTAPIPKYTYQPHLCLSAACAQVDGTIFFASADFYNHLRAWHDAGDGLERYIFCPHPSCVRSADPSYEPIQLYPERWEATMMLQQLLLLPFLITPTFSAYCDAPSPAFPIPQLDSNIHAVKLRDTTSSIVKALQDIISHDEYNTTHYSLEITSQSSTLLSAQHTARNRSTLLPGADHITDKSMYRIASMTKPFTVLALFQLQKAGKLNLDDSILEYLPELNTTGTGKGRGGLPFKDITIRALASQIAGIPRDLAQGDFLHDTEYAARLGLPEVPDEGHFKGDYILPSCDQNVNYRRACDATDLLGWVDQLPPLFAPNQKSTYSNINFDLLGLVIANVSGMSYETYIEKNILREIGMNKTSFRTPPKDVAAIPKDIEWYWPFEIGVQNPTGGLYSSSSEMSVWLRYVMSTFNAQATGVNWFNPLSFSSGLDTYYGMPWEILRARTNEVIPDTSSSTRPLTFVTKGGGLPGYTSIVIMVPEYGLGITILVAGNGKAMDEFREVVTEKMVAFAEEAALKELSERYTGVYSHEKLNSSMHLSVSGPDGLYVSSWTSNGQDVNAAVNEIYGADGREIMLYLVPTLLFVDEEKQQGERWRVVPQKRPASSTKGKKGQNIWDDFCVANVDGWGMYFGKPLSEVVFWGGNGESEVVQKVDLTGYRSTLKRTANGQNEASFRLKEQF
ncbi:hypothetical protein OHC33_000578 [Knufia fluminis]|uniref:Beta-lactamase-related domain-containing protein n=1 Tax=Knufia fluminis TaxID=191047 RepID=A0AAN8EQL6_9EURO|nr:hypothetical protein OHC33_000578 [Knufia fluminis]